ERDRQNVDGLDRRNDPGLGLDGLTERGLIEPDAELVEPVSQGGEHLHFEPNAMWDSGALDLLFAAASKNLDHVATTVKDSNDFQMVIRHSIEHDIRTSSDGSYAVVARHAISQQVDVFLLP